MNNKTLLLTIFQILFSYVVFAQPANDSLGVIQVYATVQNSPTEIHLQWLPKPNSTMIQVYRRSLGTSSWGSSIATLPNSAVNFIDVNVSKNVLYEYRVSSNGPNANGYITTGIEVELDDGDIIIVAVDTTVMPTSNTLFQQYIDDLKKECWQTKVLAIDRADNIATTKSHILNLYDENPNNTKTLVLIGHVPMPHSGNINPDGHSNHRGAWPADTYYGDVDGTWTDATVTNTSSANGYNHNIPGDGKWDQSTIPSDIDLEVGRIDMINLPAFGETETQLLEQYFIKNHAFRTKAFVPNYRGQIENNFGGFSEGFGQYALKSFVAMFGPDEVFYTDFNNLITESYIWSYGCGGGTYTSASGIGTTTDFVNNSYQSVFTAIFGSYFGDYGPKDNNFLRAPLASDHILTNAWVGRPGWNFNSMAMGKNIGFCAKISQNNTSSNYVGGSFTRFVHIALMGDPSLRMYVVEAPSNLSRSFGQNFLIWHSPTEIVDGYQIYRRLVGTQAFEQISNSLITDTSYIVCEPAIPGNYEYKIHAIKLTTSASGSFFNRSPGIFTTVNHISSLVNTEINDCITIHDYPTDDIFTIEGLFSNYQISILDSMNNIVQTLNASDCGRLNIDLSNLEGAQFYLSITNNNDPSIHALINLKP